MGQEEGKFLQKRAQEFLENAYFASRYFPVEFEKKEVENMEEFVAKFLSLLNKL